jgi:hypothetical protein
VLETAGLTEREKQRFLAGVTHNKAMITQIADHAAKLTRELEATKAELAQRKEKEDFMSAGQIKIVAAMVKSLLGADGIPDGLEKRIDNVQKDPNGVWNAMLPSVVQASAAALRFKEDAQRHTEAMKTQEMYQKYLRATGWEPTLATRQAPVPQPQQQPPLPPPHAPSLQQQQQQQQQSLVEASHNTQRHTEQPAADSFQSMREHVFKRKTADLYMDIPKQPVAKPYDAFSEARRMLGSSVPSVKFAGQQMQ